MDKKQAIAWIAAIVARGIAWVLAVKLGWAAAESESTATSIAGALAALTLAGVSIYTSIKGRKALLAGGQAEAKK